MCWLIAAQWGRLKCCTQDAEYLNQMRSKKLRKNVKMQGDRM